MIVKLYIKQKLGYGCTTTKKNQYRYSLNINDFIFYKSSYEDLQCYTSAYVLTFIIQYCITISTNLIFIKTVVQEIIYNFVGISNYDF